MGKLPNGFSYYVNGNEDVVPPNRLLLRLVVKAGWGLDEDDHRGEAHFVEHLAFAGTEHFGKGNIDDLIRNLGMTLGPDANAETGPDTTTYTLRVATDAPDTLATALAFLRGVAGDVEFDPTSHS
jgi:zinc protease